MQKPWFVWLSLLLLLLSGGCSDKESEASKDSPIPSTPSLSSDAPKKADGADEVQLSKEPANASAAETKTSNVEAELAKVQRLLVERKSDEAWKLIEPWLITNGKDPMVRFTAARVMHAQGKLSAAIKLLDLIQEDPNGPASIALGQSADWLLEAGMWREAELRFRKLQQQGNDIPILNRRLASLLVSEGRRWESVEYLQKLLRSGDFTLQELILLVDWNEPVDRSAEWAFALKADPDFLLPRIGEAQALMFKQQLEQARKMLEEVCAKHPEQIEAWVSLGRVLVEQEDREALQQWLSKMPQGAQEHPNYWTVRGLWGVLDGDMAVAVRGFGEGVKRNPDDLIAVSRLSESLRAIGEPKLAEPFWNRAKSLQLLQDLVQKIVRGNRQPELFEQIAQKLTELERPLEAISWRALGYQTHRVPKAQMDALVAQRRKLLEIGSGSQVSPDSMALDLSKWGEIKAENKSSADKPLRAGEKTNSQQLSQQRGVISLVDIASQVGLDFSFVSGDDPKTVGMRIHESNGGGVGVVDFDRDGWPDLFFAQAGGAPMGGESNQPCQLFRNLFGEKWLRVATQSGANVRCFGQGVSVADYDQDGFQDLAIATLGRNLLLRNNGDGTFSDVSDATGLTEVAWTSSLALADIDGDALPDWIEANYVAGPDVFERLCPGPDGFSRVCRPTEFAPAVDRIYRNMGDGSFELLADPRALAIEDGRGLGVVVANLDGESGNDIFVANDMSANYLLLSSKGEGEPKWKLTEEAGLRGCAVDARGRAQACMGVALGDIDRDGRLDLFVTNFYNEYNTLYLQVGPGQFLDSSRRWRIAEPSLEKLGFGTQAADFDCDGWLDLVVLNGHIDDYSYSGIPYKMRPQLFQNMGDSFAEVAVGEGYFEKERVGRSLALIDWNRDGLMDLVATYLDSPVSLIENRSQVSSSKIELQLVGVKSERDAIGAMIEMKCGEERWVTTLASGDGYQASNEKIVSLGLGQNKKVDAITIRWPSGITQQFKELPSNRAYLCVEGEEIASIGER